jgi:hypothetical protein
MSPLTESTRLTLAKTFTWNESVWNPSMIGARAWYDASDTTTVAVTSGLVDSVTDKSGNGLTLTANGSTRPTYTSGGLNGKNIFTYDGNDFLESALAAPWRFLHDSTGSSVFAVWKPGTSADPGTMYTLLGTNGALSANVGMYVAFDDRSAVGNNRLRAFITDNTGNWVSNTTSANDFATPNVNQICGWILNPLASASSRVSMRVNGGSASETNTDTAAPTTANPTFPLKLGATGGSTGFQFPLLGTIAEVVMFAGVVSDSNRQRIEGYLAWKWGLTANLPAGHPYKTIGPTP